MFAVDVQAVLEGIRKGEIVSSGAVHNIAPKEGLLNRGPREDASRGRGRGRGTNVFFTCFFVACFEPPLYCF